MKEFCSSREEKRGVEESRGDALRGGGREY